MRPGAIRHAHQGTQAHRLAAPAHLRERGDRGPARAVEHLEAGAFGGHPQRRGALVQRRQERARARVVAADLDPDRALRHGGQHLLRRQHRGGRAAHFETLEPGHGQERGIDLTLGQLAQAGLDVAAQRHHLDIGPRQQHLGLAAQRGGAHDRARRQRGQAVAAVREQGVARVLARQDGGDLQALGQPGRHVLHGVHRDVDAPLEQRLLDLLGEQALAADLGERAVLHRVAGGLDDDDLDRRRLGQLAVHRGEARAHLTGLGERQGAAARTQANKRFCRHAASFTA